MPYKFQRANRDANDAIITETFLKAGCFVLDLTSVGKGATDKLVGIFGINVLV